MVESEKYLDRKLSLEIKKIGGWTIKLVCTHLIGLPDRLCLIPGGIIFFVEVKTTKQKPRKIQIAIHKKLRALGFKVFIVDSSEALSNLIYNQI